MQEQIPPPDDISRLTPEELTLFKKQFSLLSRTNPAEALKLFREQQTTFIPPPTESPFVQTARKGKLPPKVISGGR